MFGGEAGLNPATLLNVLQVKLSWKEKCGESLLEPSFTCPG